MRTRRPELLDRRALNRALLERQLLLRRHALDPAAALEHLVGLQAQAPLAPYVALWSRLQGFEPQRLSDLLAERRAVRVHAMRSTIHLLTAPDCLLLRPLSQPVIDRQYTTGAFRRPLAGADLDAIAAAGRELLADGALTRAELGRRLAERWPDRDPAALSAAVIFLVPAVQVPPRGLWGRAGPIAWAAVESWLGAELPVCLPEPDAVVLRYLAAFGPAAVEDVRTWSGLPRLCEVVDRLRPRLRRFRDEHGRELLDLPDAPRPDPDTPAPPRLLPEYDNVLLSHADRSRINDRGHPIPLAPGNGARMGTFLVDGFYRGTWRIEGDRVALEPFEPLGREDAAALEAEAGGLLGFVRS